MDTAHYFCRRDYETNVADTHTHTHTQRDSESQYLLPSLSASEGKNVGLPRNAFTVRGLPEAQLPVS